MRCTRSKNHVYVESMSISVKASNFSFKRVDPLSLIDDYQQNYKYTHGCVLVVGKPLKLNRQGKAKFLKQKPLTWRAERENFGPLPLKCQWIRLASSLSQYILWH